MIDISKGRYWDLPLSLVDGCTPCSPGCDHCWSEGMTHRFNFQWTKNSVNPPGQKPGHPVFNGVITPRPERLSIPLKRRKPTVFSIWNDLFHEAVPDQFIHEAYGTMRQTPQHKYLLLTKRPERMNETVNHIKCLETLGWANGFYTHVYHGLTICNQQESDEKIPVFLQVPGKKFLSIEPMLGPIDFSNTPGALLPRGDMPVNVSPITYWRDIDAVILGGETMGNKPGREMKIKWVESLVDQCISAGVPVFVKQLHINGRVSKDMAEWPEKLRRRELPWLRKDR